MGDMSYTIKKYFSFSQSELRALAISILVLGFVFSYDRWGTDTFDVLAGLHNLFNSILIATLAVLVHQSVQRIVGLWVGFRVEYHLWTYGIIAALGLAVLSSGKLWFLAPGGILVYHMAGRRLGSFRYGLNYWPLGMVGLCGALTNLALAMVFKILLIAAPNNALLADALIFNVWFAIFSMLPIPPLDGSHLFFASRLTYVFAFSAVVACALAVYLLGVFISILIGLCMGTACVVLYFWYVERDRGGGHGGH